jgi:hypothetical protein
MGEVASGQSRRCWGRRIMDQSRRKRKLKASRGGGGLVGSPQRRGRFAAEQIWSLTRHRGEASSGDEVETVDLRRRS